MSFQPYQRQQPTFLIQALQQIKPESGIPQKSQGIFKVPLPIRPRVLVNNEPNKFLTFRKIAAQQAKRAKYEYLLKMHAIKNALELEQKRDLIQRIRQQQAVFQAHNCNLFLNRMKHFTSLPDYKDCIFQVPKVFPVWNSRIMTEQQMDEFIWENRMISRPAMNTVIAKSHIITPSQDESENSTDGSFISDEQAESRNQASIVFNIQKQFNNDTSSESLILSNSDQILGDNKDEGEESKEDGNQSLKIRLMKIMKYKQKLYMRRLRKPISKRFNGRSHVANQKLRINGKFVKASAISQNQQAQIVNIY